MTLLKARQGNGAHTSTVSPLAINVSLLFSFTRMLIKKHCLGLKREDGLHDLRAGHGAGFQPPPAPKGSHMRPPASCRGPLLPRRAPGGRQAVGRPSTPCWCGRGVPARPYLAEGECGRHDPDQDIQCVFHQFTLLHQDRLRGLQEAPAQHL